MAYQTYITEALVCGSYDTNTSDRSFLLFVREAGMIYASAKSVREERSKQRYALQICSHVRTTLIRGKSGWKIAGTEPIQNLYANASTREARAFLRNIVLLIRRVIRGETVYADIFDDVIDASVQVGVHDPVKLECILSLRILHRLGYIAPNKNYDAFLQPQFPYVRIDEMSETDSALCQKTIDHALLQSHL